MTQLDLLSYPHRPGSKRSEASRQAARRVTPYDGPLRQQAYEWLCDHPLGGTARDVAHGIQPDLDIESADFEKLVRNVAPRLSQMVEKGEIIRSEKLEAGATAHRYHNDGVQ